VRYIACTQHVRGAGDKRARHALHVHCGFPAGRGAIPPLQRAAAWGALGRTTVCDGVLEVHAQQQVLSLLRPWQHEEAELTVHLEETLVAAVALLVDVKLEPHCLVARGVALDAREQARGEALAAVCWQHRKRTHVPNGAIGPAEVAIDTVREDACHGAVLESGCVETPLVAE